MLKGFIEKCKRAKEGHREEEHKEINVNERKMEKGIRIGSRVKSTNTLLKGIEGRVGVVVDFNNYSCLYLVLFPGWRGGNYGSKIVESDRYPGSAENTCLFISGKDLELVRDGFEIGDVVTYIPKRGDGLGDAPVVGTVVDFCEKDGCPLVEFSESFEGCPGEFTVTRENHSRHCWYCNYENLISAKKDELGNASFLYQIFSEGFETETVSAKNMITGEEAVISIEAYRSDRAAAEAALEKLIELEA